MTATGAPLAVITLWRLLVRLIATRLRLAGLSVLGVGAVGLGLVVRVAPSAKRAGAAWSLIDGYGLSLLIPIVALVFASAALGDLAEDGTLVYVWLRPIPRWQLALSAFAASVTVAVPVAVAPLVVGAAISGQGVRLVGAAAAGSVVATIAYSALFCGLGLRVRRALAWGLVYLVIWEQAVARLSHGAARASLYVNARSLAAHIAGRSPQTNAVAWTTGLIVPVAVALIAVVVTSRSLDRGEVS